MRSLPILLACLILTSIPAFAQDAPPQPKPGETILNLSTTERQSMAQDILMASLRAEFTGTSAKDVQDKVNAAMAKAIVESKKVEGVKVSTGSYMIYPFYPNPKNLKESQWKASQTINLESKKSEDILKLTGEIQNMGLLMNNLGFKLSSEKSDEIQDVLMERALKKLMDSAHVAAKSLNKNTVELLEANVNGNVPYYPMMMRTMTAAPEMAEAKTIQAPVAEPEETEVTLTVSARLLLKP